MDEIAERFQRSGAEYIDGRSSRFEKAVIKLDALSPLATLARGYGVVYDEEQRVLRNFDNVIPGDCVKVRLKNTTADCLVEKLETTL